MAGFKILTVTSRNGDSSITGSFLFSSRYVERIFADSGGVVNLLCNTGSVLDSTILQRYTVSDSISTAREVLGAYGDVLELAVYESPSDITSSTTTKKIDQEDVVLGVPVGASDSLLYMRKGDVVEKVLVNETLTNIETEANLSAPTLSSPLNNLTYDEGFTSNVVDGSSVFTNTDESTVYTTSSSDTDVVTVSNVGTSITITEVGIGAAVITFTATNDGEGTSDTFTVTVIDVNDAPVVINPIADQNYASGFLTSLLSFSNVFSDPDGDDLSYTIASSDEGVCTVEITDYELLRFVITEVGNGTCTVTLTADDGALSTDMDIGVTIS